MARRWVLGAAAGLVFFGLSGPAAAMQDGVDPVSRVITAPVEPEPWIRSHSEREGTVLRLQTAVREFSHPEPSRPRITIAGAVHIGEQAFYEELQQILDAQDVVLYEGVKPRRSAAPGGDDEMRVQLTRSRMRILVSMLEAYRRDMGVYPESLEGLLELWPDAAHVKNPTDAWGNGLVYQREAAGDEFEIISLGADGASGGEGVDAELRMTSDERERRAPRQEEGIQKRLADAMGLVFQLEAMDHSRPHWRNSDMSAEDLRERFRDSGVEADGLFSMLDGSSMMARLSGMMLGMMGRNEQSRGLMKAMMIEMLGRADRLMSQMPGAMGAMMSVLIDERNEVLLADLERIIETEPGVSAIGIIYGAGHLNHLERRLVNDFGYRVAGERWLTSMKVDTEAAGIPPAQLQTMRQMMQRSLEAQTRRRR